MSTLAAIKALDPIKNHKEIVFLSTCFEFPFDTTRALEMALFRTYCVPSISGLLDRTGEFARCPQKRYDDTDIIVSEILEWGYDSKRGAAALALMNCIHARFEISNEDFLYVLSTFVFEPIRWNERFGWRKMHGHEKLAMFYFWRAVGERMHMHSLPASYEEFEHYNRVYEEKHFAWSESNQRIGIATRDLFASWFPRPLRPLVHQAIYAMMDESTLRAFGFPTAPPWVCRSVDLAMRLRARLLRILPKRHQPRLRTQMAHHSYGKEYCLEQLGPTYMREKR